MLPLRIAWRFLRSSPGQSALIIAGIGVGIATQIFVGSLIVSLQDNLINTTIGSAAHITVKAIKESDPVRYSPSPRLSSCTAAETSVAKSTTMTRGAPIVAAPPPATWNLTPFGPVRI